MRNFSFGLHSYESVSVEPDIDEIRHEGRLPNLDSTRAWSKSKQCQIGLKANLVLQVVASDVVTTAIKFEGKLWDVIFVRYHKIEMPYKCQSPQFTRAQLLNVDNIGDSNLSVDLCLVSSCGGFQEFVNVDFATIGQSF